MNTIRRICSLIDALSEYAGKTVSWSIPIIIGITVYEVFMRYVLSEAVVFAYDTSWMLGAAVYVVALGWVSLRNEHIRVDVVYSKLSLPTRAVLDIILSLVLFLPLCFLLTKIAVAEAVSSVATGELSSVSYWRPPMWPFRVTIAVGLVILLMQEVVVLLRNAYFLLSGGKSL